MDEIKLKVNGVEYSVGSNVTSDVMLLDYLRTYLQLRGTKYSCREGGCGACIVTASKSIGAPSVAVNSCLVAVTQCHGWEITTIEGLGNRKKGYHVLQTTLAEHHGTQCGYCSPGWVMSMHGFMEQNKTATMLEIEKAFGSNLCRCTGYRPIVEGFKKFGKDASKKDRIMDIEDLYICKKTGKNCEKSSCDEDDWCMVQDEDVNDNKIIKITLKDGKVFYKANVLADVFNILKSDSADSYMLIGGNTAKGVSPIFEYPRIMIDINSVPELKVNKVDQNLIVGAGLTLTEFLNILKTASEQEYFSYLSKLYDHIELVAHIPVRNVGTIAGNLMIKHQNNVFQSDIYLLFETVGAYLTILDWNGVKQVVSMQQFLKVKMRGKVIVNVLLPPLNETEYELVTFKIMPRAQSAHAIVNAGFLYKLNKTTNIVQSCRIVYGALSKNFIRASATEAYLVGKSLFTNETLQAALKVLDGELVIVDNPPEPSVEFRRYLAKALFYKGLLTICPSSLVLSRYSSGSVNLHHSRQLSDGRQIFTTNPSLWPLNQPIAKIEGLIQCAGEAQYTEDIPSFHNEVFGAFVLSTVALGIIIKQDASAALKLPGVIAYYTAKDIPGLNSFTPADSFLYAANEEVLCDGTVKYYHQPIGIIVAETQHVADRAVKLVKVKYSSVKTPVLDIKKARNDSTRNTLFAAVDATDKGTDVQKVITGSNVFCAQYHFTMETLVCVAKPTEEGLEVHSATQWLDGTHVMISRALNIDENKIDVYVRRIGGGYGMKISRSIQSAVACSLVVQKLNRPCRFIQPLTTNTRAVGKRLPCVNDFEVGINSTGVIQYIDSTIYEDNGYKINETLTALGYDVYYNCYDATKWNYKAYDTITDTAKNTWCRAPGTLEAIAFAEYVMEQISYEMSLDPVDVRLANLDTTKFSDMSKMIETLKTSAEYTARRATVDSYNTQNRWKKRGLRFSFSRWAPAGSQRFDINLSVFHGDGSIIITHGGVEMGQGINTKAMQMAAYLLKVPMDKIQIKGNNTITSPNSFISGGSLTTQNVCIGLRRCCEELQARIKPIQDTLTDPAWEDVVTACYAANIDLQCHGYVGTEDTQTYNVYGIACAEVEVDFLTGEFEIIRVDLLQDVGVSVSPEIDVGQIEGAFIMGLGYWTCEKLQYASTGELLTDRTWDIHLPEARDIPQDFRVYFKASSSNDLILGSKGLGEPPICLSVVIPFAIREAITEQREESGIASTEWFTIVGCEISSKVSQLDYLREWLQLRGTKYMCREAGCGACIVATKKSNSDTRAVNSCMVPIASCHGWEITTIEETGNRKKGYHPLQKALAQYNGSLCGYWMGDDYGQYTMYVYSLLQSQKDHTQKEIEFSLASNIFRCTGYRPILEAFKKFAIDAPKTGKMLDIEDLDICKNSGKICTKSCEDDNWCILSMDDLKIDEVLKIDFKDGKVWYKAVRVVDIFEILNVESYDSYKLICGNTAKGAYPHDDEIDNPRVLIDISDIQELKGHLLDQNLVIGAGTTLSELLKILLTFSQEDYFSYLNTLYDYIMLVAHIAVRNIGSIAGNLMLKHRHREFQSDIFLLLETVGAQLTLVHSRGSTEKVTMQQFLNVNMKGVVIMNVMLPPLTDQHKITTFKIMPRTQNAHAIVHAGFLYELNPEDTVLEARIVYGGLSPYFIRALGAEHYLKGKRLFGCSEPPICMAVSVPIAIREAIVSARHDTGLPSTTWFNIDGPFTTEAICMACATETSDFKFC